MFYHKVELFLMVSFGYIYKNLQISIIRKNFSKNIENLKMSSSFVLKERQVK